MHLIQAEACFMCRAGAGWGGAGYLSDMLAKVLTLGSGSQCASPPPPQLQPHQPHSTSCE